MTEDNLPGRKMVRLTVVVRARDSYQRKPLSDILLALYKDKGISGATVLQGIRGYGARGVARADILGLSIDLPLVIETVAPYAVIQEVLPTVKHVVGANGLITLEEVSVV